MDGRLQERSVAFGQRAFPAHLRGADAQHPVGENGGDRHGYQQRGTDGKHYRERNPPDELARVPAHQEKGHEGDARCER